MNHLLAEIKERGRGVKTFKVFSDEEVYSLPTDLINPKLYNSDYKLEDDEWFHIPDFTSSPYCLELLKNDFISADYNQATAGQLKKIKYLCSYQIHDGGEYYFFQKILPSRVIEKKWFKLSNTPTLEKDSSILVLNTIADAIYKKSENVLYFKNLATIAVIFKGISELYKEATQEETEEFLNKSFIAADEEFNADKVGKANRKRIALAMETLNNFSPVEMLQLNDYVKEYCANLTFNEDESNFVVKNETDLKDLLWGIEQRYYTTPIGEEKRVANSVSIVTE